MFGSLRIGTIRGIPIRIHITLLAMFAVLVVKLGWQFGFPAFLILFGSVLLHELGHSIVAQRYGIRIAGIVLHLLGGMALMAKPPEKPRQEIAIAAAGPLVSFVLGLTLFGVALVTGVPLGVNPFNAPPLNAETLLLFGASVNMAMGVFNLIPALPMDGGRIFRATLATWLGGLRATRVAASVARVFGVLFIGWAIYSEQWSFGLVGGLLFIMVGHEVRVAEALEERKRRSEMAERETREEAIDPFGRRYVVITRLADDRT